MTWLDHAPLAGVFRRRDQIEINEPRLRALVERGEVVRIAPGSYAWRQEWQRLEPLAQHAQRVWEAAARLQPGAVFVGPAAAALWGIDLLGSWPPRIDVAVAATGGGRSTGIIMRHTRPSPRIGTLRWGEHFVSTPVRTAVELAATRPLAAGVASMDQTLWAERPGGPLATEAELLEAAASFVGRGAARVLRSAQFADPRAANVRESQSRVLIEQLGFPAPELQHRFVLPSGRVAFSDFWWPEFRTIGELDGLGKYLDERMRAGRSPAQVLADEKDREDELRRTVRGVARWRVPVLDTPAVLWDILTAAGLPASRRRPGR